MDELQVIGVRYRRSRLAQDDERSLDAYAKSGVYGAANVPFSVVEPRFPEAERVEDEPANIGRLGAEIATAVSSAHSQNKAILMTGGDCTHITGIVGGLQDVHGADARIGLVWFDAHGDFNTPRTSLSGMLGGMPVAVCAGLAFPHWREASHIASPLPTDRIVMLNVRNLDEAEEQLIRATDVVITEMDGLQTAVSALAQKCDLIYLHIDIDILDESYVPNHETREPDGATMEEVLTAVNIVMATQKVATLAVVSVYGTGEGYEISQTSGIELIRGSLQAWQKHGMPR